MDKLIEIGKITSTRGLDGTVKVQTQFNVNDFLNLKFVIINNKQLKILKMSGKNGWLFFRLENISTVEQAELLKNQNVFVLHENILLKEGEYLIDDLLNMQVITDENILMGTLFSVENFGSKDVYTVKNKNKEYIFCLIDDLIEKVDFENQKIILNSKVLNEVLL